MTTERQVYMRILLSILCIITALVYIAIYSFFEPMLQLLENVQLSDLAFFLVRASFLVAAGFCIGTLGKLMFRWEGMRTSFNAKTFLTMGLIPLLLLIFSQGTLMQYLVNLFFGNSRDISELLFYLFSQQAIWALWVGFSLGCSTDTRPASV